MKIAFGLVPQFASIQTYEASVAGCVPPTIGVGGTASQSRAPNVSTDGRAFELGRRYTERPVAIAARGEFAEAEKRNAAADRIVELDEVEHEMRAPARVARQCCIAAPRLETHQALRRHGARQRLHPADPDCARRRAARC